MFSSYPRNVFILSRIRSHPSQEILFSRPGYALIPAGKCSSPVPERFRPTKINFANIGKKSRLCFIGWQGNCSFLRDYPNFPVHRRRRGGSFKKSRIKMLQFRIFRINLLWIFHNSLLVGVVRIVSAPPLLPLRIKELPESVGIAIPMHNCIIAFFMSPAYAKLLKGKTLCLGIGWQQDTASSRGIVQWQGIEP